MLYPTGTEIDTAISFIQFISSVSYFSGLSLKIFKLVESQFFFEKKPAVVYQC